MDSTASPPRVSVIVRTMGRTTLPRAIAAIVAQTHRPVEIVAIDAAGSGFEPVAPRGVTLKVLHHGPLDRPRALNAGLAAASGTWIAFLDEDDEILPAHFEQLLATALVAGVPVAYSQTRLVGAGGALQRVFGAGPFSRAALLRSNYLHIAAVLFHRSLVDEGARFDESFKTFEDWDFWLQLSARVPFAFTGHATAVYHAEEGQSGAGAGGNLDRGAAAAQHGRLMEKWLIK